MSVKTRKLTLSALFSALAVIMLYVASVWPTGQFGLAAVASLFVAAAVVETGISGGVSVFIISSFLGMLLLPNRAAPLLFLLFFGFYPVLKSLIERMPGTALQWFFKLLVFNTSLTVTWFFFRSFFIQAYETVPGVLVIYLGGNLLFALFDYGFTKLVWFYIERISRRGFGGFSK